MIYKQVACNSQKCFTGIDLSKDDMIYTCSGGGVGLERLTSSANDVLE